MYLGVDLGISGVKAVLLEEDGALVAQATAPLTLAAPQPLWREQDPAAWWEGADNGAGGMIRRGLISRNQWPKYGS